MWSGKKLYCILALVLSLFCLVSSAIAQEITLDLKIWKDWNNKLLNIEQRSLNLQIQLQNSIADSQVLQGNITALLIQSEKLRKDLEDSQKISSDQQNLILELSKQLEDYEQKVKDILKKHQQEIQLYQTGIIILGSISLIELGILIYKFSIK